MSNENDNKKWLNEYPELSKVNPANAFKVPGNYFEEMEGRVMNEITLTKIIEAHPQGGFATPANYFDELTGNIQSRIAIDAMINNGKGFTIPDNYFNELTSDINSRIAIDEVLHQTKGFTVPENYFEDLGSNIAARVAIDELLNNEKGFTVPDNYFEELSDNIGARVAVEELLDQEQGFTVPAGYFNGLEARILQKTAGAIEAPVEKDTAVVRKLWASAAFKYATAACFAIFLGGAVLTTEFNDTAIHNRSDLHKALAKVSKTDMETYLELNGDASTLMENADPNILKTITADDQNSEELN